MYTTRWRVFKHSWPTFISQKLNHTCRTNMGIVTGAYFALCITVFYETERKYKTIINKGNDKKRERKREGKRERKKKKRTFISCWERFFISQFFLIPAMDNFLLFFSVDGDSFLSPIWIKTGNEIYFFKLIVVGGFDDNKSSMCKNQQGLGF